MKTVTRKIYEFHELSAIARESVKNDHREIVGYNFEDDAIASLKALAEHFGAKLSRYEIDFFDCSYSSAEFDCPEIEEEEIERLLGELGTFDQHTLKCHGECKLTGYCADEDAIDGFRWAWRVHGERELPKLLEAAFRNWLNACQADCEDYYSDEQFAEMCQANECFFYANGEFYDGSAE